MPTDEYVAVALSMVVTCDYCCGGETGAEVNSFTTIEFAGSLLWEWVDEWWGTMDLEHSRGFMEEQKRQQFLDVSRFQRLLNVNPPMASRSISSVHNVHISLSI